MSRIKSWGMRRACSVSARPASMRGTKLRTTSIQSSTDVVIRSAPAWLFGDVNAQGHLADELVREQGVGGMESAAAHVAVQPLQLVALVHTGAAGHGHRQ